MQSYIQKIAILIAALALSACVAAGPSKDYSAFYESNPRSILIVPVINHSNEVSAADLFLATLPAPLAERGYYVFPVNLTKSLIENDGLSDAQLVHTAQTSRLSSLFGADSVLYIEILDWKAEYIVIASNVRVKFLYTLKDGKSGNLIWQDEQEAVVSNSSNSGNILADVVANAVRSAIENASADYTYVAVQANAMALYGDGRGIPHGPYSKKREENSTKFPSNGTGQLSNAQTQAVSYPVDPSTINKSKK